MPGRGAPRVPVTAEGFEPFDFDEEYRHAVREKLRRLEQMAEVAALFAARRRAREGAKGRS